MPALVLSLFPGIGMLDMAFEEAGFCIVRGPDHLWGGDVRRFFAPAGRFDGVIGGPPCQCHSRLVHLNRSQGAKIAPDLVPEFQRVVSEADPAWFLMENVPDVPDVQVPGYTVQRVALDNRWLGGEQSRRRAFQFGARDKIAVGRFAPELEALESPIWEPACLASEGRRGMILMRDGKSRYTERRTFERFCELQGLPQNFLDDAPLTLAGKYRVVGNGVPLRMGRAVASAVKRALEGRAE